MKELSGTALNYFYTENDKGELKPQVELILVVSEPTYKLSVDDMIRERQAETIRISTNRKGVKSLIASLLAVENELEEKEKKVAAVVLSQTPLP